VPTGAGIDSEGVAVLRRDDVAVREGTDADIPALDLLRRLPQPRDGGRDAKPREDPSPGPRVFVAEVGGEVVGMVTIGREPVGPVVGVTALEIAELHVRGGYEQWGVGSALVAAATAEAELLGCEHVLLTVPHAGTESGVVSTRLGLGAAGRRLAPVSMLRRRLGLEPVSRDSVAARRRAVLRRVDTS
jgi:GNAT superfamily N-acetyltransferase